VFLVNIGGDTAAQARAIDALRSTLAVGSGSAVIVRGSPELRAQTDVWGPIGDGLSLMRAVKRQFDPAGILNAGRGPGNL
jgi:FAD/FMN-containing dehydrogenase